MPSVADVIDAIARELPDVTVRFGEEFQQENEAAPRVVFIPREDTFAPTTRKSSAGFHSTSILDRGRGLEARIWAAAAEDATETWPAMRALDLLVDRVALAIHKVTYGSLIWEGGSALEASLALYGRGYSLRFRVTMPVVPTADESPFDVTTFTEVLSPDAPPAIESTVTLGADETAVPSP